MKGFNDFRKMLGDADNLRLRIRYEQRQVVQMQAMQEAQLQAMQSPPPAPSTYIARYQETQKENEELRLKIQQVEQHPLYDESNT